MYVGLADAVVQHILPGADGTCVTGRDGAVLRAEAEGLADVLGAAGAEAAAAAASRAQLGAQLAQALRRLAQARPEPFI